MQNDFVGEISVLKQHISRKPDSMLFARLADRYLQLREVDRAIDICHQGLKNHPTYTSAYFVLAKCHVARKEYDEAAKGLKKVLSLEHDFLQAQKLYNDIKLEIGFDRDAPGIIDEEAETYEQAVDISDDEYLLDESFPGLQSTPEEKDVYRDETKIQAPAEDVETDLAAEQLYTQESKIEEELPEPELPRKPDEDQILKREPRDFEEEETRFSKILDDLFSSNIDDEEKKEKETRSKIERVASRTPEPREKPAERPKEKTVLPDEEDFPSKFTKENRDDKGTEDDIEYPASGLGDTAETIDHEEPTEPELMESSAPPLQDRIEPEPDTGDEDRNLSVDEDEDIQQKTARQDVAEQDETSDSQDSEDYNNLLSGLDRMAEHDQEVQAEIDQPISFDKPEEFGVDTESQSPTDEESEQDSSGQPKEKFVTPTLGEIYAAQGQYAKAISVFETLLKKNPENDWYKTKLEYLKKRLEEENK